MNIKLLRCWLSGLLLFVVVLPLSAQTDSLNFKVIGQIYLSGNLKTKDNIIFRELTFTAGDTLLPNELKQALDNSVKNLQRLLLFHFIETEIIDLPNNTADIKIKVQERWFTWLWPIFDIADRNFNAWLAGKDLSRISYGLFFQQENFRGRLEKLHIILQGGYGQEITTYYEAPYLNKRKTLGAGVILSAARDREIAFRIRENKPEYFRYSNFLQNHLEAGAFLRFRPGVHTTHTFLAKVDSYKFSDTLMALNPDYASIESNNIRIPVLAYFFKADFRDQRAYPLSGRYVDALAEWNIPSTPSGYNYLTLRASARQHLPLSEKWNFALEATGKLSTSGNKPWFRNQALGYNRDYVRGYEYQVVDGDHFWIVKSNIRYAILPQRIFKLGFIKVNQFNTIPISVFTGAFLDTGQAWGTVISHESNTLQNKVLIGGGLGVDVVTYYDKVLRTELSINREGKVGLFIHFMAAI